jgi:hemolysin activation/secretion protein
LQLSSELHHRVTRGAGLALETHVAARFSSERILGEWERWPVGGAASLRGHDEEAFRVDRYALARLEWRWFVGPQGQRLALFWDHAEMQTRVALPAGGDELQHRAADGTGVGLRVPAAGGDVDLDYGLQPGHGFLEGKIHLRLVTSF